MISLGADGHRGTLVRPFSFSLLAGLVTCLSAFDFDWWTVVFTPFVGGLYTVALLQLC